MSKKSDDGLLNKLFAEYRQIMLKIALRILRNRQEAEDAVQDAFMRIIDNFQKISQLPREQRTFYFISVIENISYNILKSKSNHPVEDIEDHYELSGFYSIEKKVEEKMLLEDVESALKELSERDYGILYLLYFEQMTPHEIAETLDISEKNIYKYIDRAKFRFSKILNERGVNYDI